MNKELKNNNEINLSDNTSMVYDKFKEFLDALEKVDAKYCINSKICTSKFLDSIHRGTLLFDDVVDIAQAHGVFINILKYDKFIYLDKINSTTLTFKDVVLMLDSIGWKMKFLTS